MASKCGTFTVILILLLKTLFFFPPNDFYSISVNMSSDKSSLVSAAQEKSTELRDTHCVTKSSLVGAVSTQLLQISMSQITLWDESQVEVMGSMASWCFRLMCIFKFLEFRLTLQWGHCTEICFLLTITRWAANSSGRGAGCCKGGSCSGQPTGCGSGVQVAIGWVLQRCLFRAPWLK